MPRAGPKWAKITKNGPWCLRGGPQKVPLSKLMDKINLGTVWVAFWPCLDPWGPETVSVGPKSEFIWALYASCGLKPKNGHISGWTNQIANPWTLLPRANPLKVVPTPQNSPNTLLQAVFAHRVPVYPHFGGFWPVRVHRKGVQNGLKNNLLQK